MTLRYLEEIEWTRMSILNVARMGKFSFDRNIREYADEIWKVKPVKVELERNTPEKAHLKIEGFSNEANF